MLVGLGQRTGNKPIVLMGGGTSKIGDPSGKDESRRLLSEDEIARNMAGIRRVFDRFLTFDAGPPSAVTVNNVACPNGPASQPFLCEYGRRFSVNRTLLSDTMGLTV